MAVLVTARLLLVFKPNRLCHFLPSMNCVISYPRLLALALLLHLLWRPSQKPSEILILLMPLLPSSCFLFFTACCPALWRLRRRWRAWRTTVGPCGGRACCVHREDAFLGIRYSASDAHDAPFLDKNMFEHERLAYS